MYTYHRFFDPPNHVIIENESSQYYHRPPKVGTIEVSVAGTHDDLHQRVILFC